MKKKITVFILFALIIVSNIFAFIFIQNLKEEIATTRVMHTKNMEEMMKTVEEETEREMVKSNPIYFVGDSITRRNDWQNTFPYISIVNKGIDGNKTSDLLKRIEPIANAHPSKLFLMIGINDFLRNKEFDETVKNYEKILQTIKDKSPHTVIYVQSVLPISRTLPRYSNQDLVRFNQQIKGLASKYNATYIDLYPLFLQNGHLGGQYAVDGLHLSKTGYDLWTQKISSYIN
ncbi:MAG TPA: hypothetical protein DDY49_01145 [Paenibacillaceae bacterium]|nr:hypothetical protein [Paenibacillaceae bacterium]